MPDFDVFPSLEITAAAFISSALKLVLLTLLGSNEYLNLPEPMLFIESPQTSEPLYPSSSSNTKYSLY